MKNRNPNYRKNLRPWTTETAPRGRKNAGLSVNEERNRMADKTPAEIQAIADLPNSTSAQIAAAKQWLRALEDDSALAAICDYTCGKPTQVNVNHEVVNVRSIVTRDTPSRTEIVLPDALTQPRAARGDN